jgi:hypothetical protein
MEPLRYHILKSSWAYLLRPYHGGLLENHLNHLVKRSILTKILSLVRSAHYVVEIQAVPTPALESLATSAFGVTVKICCYLSLDFIFGRVFSLR